MGGSIWNTITDLAKVPQNLGSTIQDIISNPVANFNGLADWFSADTVNNGRYEGAYGFGQTAASAAPSVRDLAPKIEDEQEFVEIDVAQKRFLSISEQKELASYALYGVPKFYIPPILMVNSANALAQLEGSGAEKSDVRCFIFISVGDLKIEDTTYPRNVPILKVPDADIDAVQDLGFGSGTIKVSGRLWGEAGYARLRTLRELCKTRRPLIWSAQETQAWLVFPQNVPGINTVANMPGQYFFEVTLVCVGKIADRDPIVKAALQTRTALVKHKFAREMAVLTAHKQFKKFSATGGGFFWNPADEETLVGQVSSGLSQVFPNTGGASTSGAGGLATTEPQTGATVPDIKQAATKKNDAIQDKRMRPDLNKTGKDFMIEDGNLVDSEINLLAPKNTTINMGLLVASEQEPLMFAFRAQPLAWTNSGTLVTTGAAIDATDEYIQALPPAMVIQPTLNTAFNPLPSTIARIQGAPHPDSAIIFKDSVGKDTRWEIAWRYTNMGGRIEINGKNIETLQPRELLVHQIQFVLQANKYFAVAEALKTNPSIEPGRRLKQIQHYEQMFEAYNSAADVLGAELIKRATAVIVSPDALTLTKPLVVEMQDGRAARFNGQAVNVIGLSILLAYKQLSQINLNQAVVEYNAAAKIGATGLAGIAMANIEKYRSAINVIGLEIAIRNLGEVAVGIAESVLGGQVRRLVAGYTLIGMNAQVASCNALLGDTPSNLGVGLGHGGHGGAGAMSHVRMESPRLQKMPPADIRQEDSYRQIFKQITKEKVLK